MSWNHRVIKHDNDTYEILEVYYTKDGKPEMYCKPFLCGDDLVELKEILKRMVKCLDKPVLTDNDFVS